MPVVWLFVGYERHPFTPIFSTSATGAWRPALKKFKHRIRGEQGFPRIL
jgi:hypothetical protein